MLVSLNLLVIVLPQFVHRPVSQIILHWQFNISIIGPRYIRYSRLCSLFPGDILKNYEKRFPEKFRALHLEENKHQGGAKNAGLKQSGNHFRNHTLYRQYKTVSADTTSAIINPGTGP